MSLMITKKPVYTTQADMVIIIREKEWHDTAPKGNLLQRCIQRLRTTDLEKRIRYVYYTAAIDFSAFEKNYAKALNWAVRHGYETVAVSCEDEVAFILANKFSKRFAEERDMQILLCLSENVTLSGSSIVKLESIFFDDEEPTSIKQHSKEDNDYFPSPAFESLYMPIGKEEADTDFLLDEEERDADYGIWEERDFAPPPMPQAKAPQIQSRKMESSKLGSSRPQAAKAKPKGDFRDLQEFLKQNDAGFKDTLIKYIDRTGKKDSEIYRKANVDRRLFSKILNVQGYNPSKPTAIAFAIALELNLEETKDLIGRAGYTLSQASTFDRIIEFFILERNYDIYEINEALFYFDQSLLGC